MCKYNEQQKIAIYKWRSKHRQSHRLTVLRATAKLRMECLAWLGGKCVLCGSSELLEFDHINNDGGKHRKSLGGNCGQSQMLRDWKKRGRPTQGEYALQLLCATCHAVKTAVSRCGKKK